MEFNLLIAVLLAVFCLNCFITGTQFALYKEKPLIMAMYMLIYLLFGFLFYLIIFTFQFLGSCYRFIDGYLHITFWRGFYFGKGWSNIAEKDLILFNQRIDKSMIKHNKIKAYSIDWCRKAVNKRHNYTHSKQNN